MKSIIITGTSGALGNQLRQYFIESGFNVIGTVGRSMPRNGEIAIDLGDWGSFGKLREFVKKKKIISIIHTAAILQGKSNRKKMIAANVTGTRNVLQLAKETSCHNFIQISSVGVYGIKALGKNRDETTPINGVEAYGITKRKAEELVRSSGIPYTILRLPLIKYSGDFYIEKQIKKGKSVFIRNRASNIVSTVSPVFVADTCKKITDRGALNDSFNCASHHQTWRDMIIDHCKHENIKILNDREISLIKAFSLGLVVGVIALFGQHFPSEKLMKALYISARNTKDTT